MNELAISEEVAENEVQKLLDFYEIEIDDIDNNGLKSSITSLKKAVRKGRLEIKDEGIIVQTLKRHKGEIGTLEYKELNGQAKKAMGRARPDDANGRLYELLGSLSGMGSKAISNLRGVDLSLAESIGVVLMLV